MKATIIKKATVLANFNYGSSRILKKEVDSKHQEVLKVEVNLPKVDLKLNIDEYVYIKLSRGVLVNVSHDGLNIDGVAGFNWQNHKGWETTKYAYRNGNTITYSPTEQELEKDINEAIRNNQF